MEQTRLLALKELMQVGHCAESRTAVHNTCNNTERLMGVYFYYIKQCTQKDFPSLEFLRANFGTQVAPWGGYIDTKGKVKACKKNVFIGDADAQMEVAGYDIALCWVRHNSKLEVWVKDHAHLHIDCFEDSEVKVHIEGKGTRVYINTYANSEAEIDGFTERAVSTIHDCKTYKK